MLPVIGNDRYRFPIVPYKHTGHGWTPFSLKSDTVSDLEIKHPLMRAHLAQKAEALHDSMVEVDQFCFGEFINVDLGHRPSNFRVNPNFRLSFSLVRDSASLLSDLIQVFSVS